MKQFLSVSITCILSLFIASCNKEEPNKEDNFTKPYVCLCTDAENYFILDSSGNEIIHNDYRIVSMKSPSEYYGYMDSGNKAAHSFRVIKNGKTLYDFEKGSDGVYGKMIVENGDVYSIFRTLSHLSGSVYKNDQLLYDLEVSPDNPYGYNAIAGIFVKGNDIYVCGCAPSPIKGYSAMVWKNGKILYTLSKGYHWDGCANMCVKGDDLYFCGRDGNDLVVWKNGEVLYKWEVKANYTADLECIECIDGDIYTCGYITPPEYMGAIGVIYKNEEKYFEVGSGKHGDTSIINSIKKFNNDIYFSGVVRKGTWSESLGWQYDDTPTLWKNKEIIFEKSFTNESSSSMKNLTII